MPIITVKVEPAAKDNVGWDVFVTSWNDSVEELTIHRIAWSNDADGTYTATTANLPTGVYGVLAELVGAGREISVTVDGEPTVVQPAGGSWPMEVKVNSAIEPRTTKTCYFRV